jgi:cytochrome c oxidase subunit 3
MSNSGHNEGAHSDHGHGEAVYPYTPHHFHAARQHLESGKMGVWLFLVTEILFFAGLFCAYTIYRAQHPEVFYWAHFYLDTKWGAVNTVVLIFSSFTAAFAVRNAQLGQKKWLRINIAVTILCAFAFMGVKTIEYTHKFHDGLVPVGNVDGKRVLDSKFHPRHEVWETHHFIEKHPEAAAAALRISEGLKLRKNKQASVRDEVLSDAKAVLRLTPVGDTEPVPPTATAGVSAPAVAGPAVASSAPRAGGVKPAGPADVVAEASPEVKKQEKGQAAPVPVAAAETAPPVVSPTPMAKVVALSDEAWLYRQISALTYAERHPLEMAGVIREPSNGALEFARPPKAGIFFGIYFFMTGLHGFHVLVGIGLWIWMLVISSRRQFGPKYFGPIEFTALYWHLVDLIWIYLFPMLYLIH